MNAKNEKEKKLRRRKLSTGGSLAAFMLHLGGGEQFEELGHFSTSGSIKK